MNRLDIGQFAHTVFLTPNGKFKCSPYIGSPGFWIPDIGNAKLNEAPLRIRIAREQLRQHGRPGDNTYNVLGHACFLLPIVNDKGRGC